MRAAAFAAALAAATAAQAAGGPPATTWPATPFDAAARALPSFDEDDDEDLGLLEPPPGRGRGTGNGRSWRPGMRAGLFLPLASGESWYPSLSVGGYYQTPLWGGTIELGLDYTRIDLSGGASSSHLLLVRGDMLFEATSLRNGELKIYWLAGAQLGSEWAVDTRFDTDARNAAATLDLGAGMSSPGGQWDVRASYSAVLGSDKGSGALVISGGMLF